MSTERPRHFAHLLQISKKYLWSLILYIFLPVFIHVYSPGAGADNPLGSEFLPFVTLVICCKFLPFNDFLTVFFPYKSIRDQIWSCHKKGQDQPKVIIWTNFDGTKAPMLHTKAQGHWPFGSRIWIRLAQWFWRRSLKMVDGRRMHDKACPL